jgi:hypothetical protein
MTALHITHGKQKWRFLGLYVTFRLEENARFHLEISDESATFAYHGNVSAHAVFALKLAAAGAEIWQFSFPKFSQLAWLFLWCIFGNLMLEKFPWKRVTNWFRFLICRQLFRSLFSTMKSSNRLFPFSEIVDKARRFFQRLERKTWRKAKRLKNSRLFSFLNFNGLRCLLKKQRLKIIWKKPRKDFVECLARNWILSENYCALDEFSFTLKHEKRRKARRNGGKLNWNNFDVG